MMRWALQICLVVVALVGSASVASAKCNHAGRVGEHLHHCSSGFICGLNAKSNSLRNALIAEAKRRGLSCTIRPIKNATKALPSPLKKSFITISKDQRKAVQTYLSEEDFYTSTIDGLYGKGTAAALKAYNREYLGGADLTRAANAKALIADLLKKKPSETETATEVVLAVEPKKCMGSPTQDIAVKMGWDQCVGTFVHLGGWPKSTFEWQSGMENGQGIFELADGTILDVIFKDGKGETVKVTAAPLAEQEQEVAELAPAPPLDFAQVKLSYDGKDYSKAFTDAQVLAIQGDADAQLLLGKMYVDGRGTIQVATAAHMWFNIASMSGSDEAYEQRKAVTVTMTPSAVEKAQAMAVTCIQSAYTDCGLTVKPVVEIPEPVAKTVTDLASLKSYFKDQSLLKRKQIQYALKKLGVYSSSVDGAWGNGTATAVSNYQNLQDLQTAPPSELYQSALAKVDVPSSFAAAKKVPKKVPKKKQTSNTQSNTAGLTAIISNPSMSGTQALAVCRPQANLAKSQARSGYQSPSFGTTVRCRGSGYGINCNSSANSGGFAGGFASGLAKGMAAKRAYSSVLSACLASYGWRD